MDDLEILKTMLTKALSTIEEMQKEKGREKKRVSKVNLAQIDLNYALRLEQRKKARS